MYMVEMHKPLADKSNEVWELHKCYVVGRVWQEREWAKEENLHFGLWTNHIGACRPEVS